MAESGVPLFPGNGGEGPQTTTVAIWNGNSDNYGVHPGWIAFSIFGFVAFIASFLIWVSKCCPHFARSSINLCTSVIGLCILPVGLVIGWCRNNPNAENEELEMVVIVCGVTIFFAIIAGRIHPNARWAVFWKFMDIVISTILKTPNGLKFLKALNNVIGRMMNERNISPDDMSQEGQRILALQGDEQRLLNEEPIVID